MNTNRIKEMTPAEFEIFIERLLANQGYEIDHISQGDDIGIDIIASDNLDRIAIQIKKYLNRKINLDIIYHSFGAAAFHDCSRSVIVTLHDLTENAKRAAEKLNVEIWGKDKIIEMASKICSEGGNINQSNRVKKNDWFDIVWNNEVKILEGEHIPLLSGRGINTVLKVNEDGVYVESSNGKKRNIDIEIFKQIMTKLKDEGRVTRSYVNDQYKSRGSSAICAILAKLTEVNVDDSANSITLLWNK